MKTHVKCDRCGTYAEMVQDGYRGRPPDGWFHLRLFGEPIRVNEYIPEGPLQAELCPECSPIVERAAQAAISRKT